MLLLLSMMRGLLRSIRRLWAKLRIVWAVLALAVFWFGGAALFYLAEHRWTDYASDNRKECLGLHGYWAALNYAATLFTTIGYGNTLCCSWQGRLFSCFYIVFGTATLFVVLDAIGKAFVRVTSFVWRRVKCLARRIRRTLFNCYLQAPLKQRRDVAPCVPRNKLSAVRASSEKSTEEEVLPLSIGIAFSLGWVLAVSWYFSKIEGWSYSKSVYVMWITFTTVGLGDVAPTHFEYTALNFLLIIIGLSLFSMCINILQMHIEDLVQKMQYRIEAQYREKVALEGEKKSDTKERTSLSIRNGDRLLSMFLSNRQVKKIKRLKETRLSVQNKAVQVNLDI